MDIVDSFSFLTNNAYGTWALCFVDSNNNKWFSRNFFPTRHDAKRWGEHMKNEMQVCVNFRPYLLSDILTSYEDSLNRYLS